MDAPMRDHDRTRNFKQFMQFWMLIIRTAAGNRRRRILRIQHLARERRRRFQHHQEQQRVAILVMVMLVNDMVPNPRRMWVKRRLRNFWEEIYYGDLWEETDWRENLRMSRATFEVICQHIRPAIERQNTRMRMAVPHHERLAVTLWKLATVIEYRSLGQKFGLGRSTVNNIVHDTCRAICEILQPICVKFPTGRRLNNIVEGYRTHWGFPQCVGAIDGMHVPIKAPSENPADYYNRKSFHSIVLQGVCDYRYRFIDVFFGFAGRAHDARVLANSRLYEMAITGQLLPNQTRHIAGHDVPLVLIGDPAYPLLPWLMKPFAHRGQLNQVQNRFNYRHSRARMTIENTFGRLKGRWRCLLKKNDFHLENVHKIVLACCVLHNICEIHNERFNPNWQEILGEYEDDDPLRMENQIVNARQMDVNEAQTTRGALMQFFQH